MKSPVWLIPSRAFFVGILPGCRVGWTCGAITDHNIKQRKASCAMYL